MVTRLRAVEGSALRLEIRATCTPGGVGHAWVKSRWNIRNDGSGSEVIDRATGFRRVFIPARITDNPYLANTEYARSLEALPEASRKALLLGRWDCFEGAVFSEWDYDRHTCEPFEVPESWEMWRACDDGYAAPACVLWLAHDTTYDRIFVVDELYARGLGPEELAGAVLQRDKRFERDLDGVIDSAAFAEIGLGTTGGKGSRGDIMNARGCRWRPAEKGSGSRVHGLSVIHQRLASKKDGFPGLVITRNCRNLIRTLPALVYDRANVEDVSDSCEQHATDALRYGLTRRRVEVCVGRVYGL
jgi:hypothetical protein